MMTDWKEGGKLLLLAQFDMRRKNHCGRKKEFHNNSYCAKPWICPLGVSGTKVSFPLRQKTLRIVEVYFYSELIASDIIRLEEKELFFGLFRGIILPRQMTYFFIMLLCSLTKCFYTRTAHFQISSEGNCLYPHSHSSIVGRDWGEKAEWHSNFNRHIIFQ